MFCFCRNFCIRRDFISDPKTLKKRLMIVGVLMLLLSPFLVIFMLVYLFLRHAEQFYNHPSTASSRRWSNLSKWMFREFNEVSFLWYELDRLKNMEVVIYGSLWSLIILGGGGKSCLVYHVLLSCFQVLVWVLNGNVTMTHQACSLSAVHCLYIFHSPSIA